MRVQQTPARSTAPQPGLDRQQAPVQVSEEQRKSLDHFAACVEAVATADDSSMNPALEKCFESASALGDASPADFRKCLGRLSDVLGDASLKIVKQALRATANFMQNNPSDRNGAALAEAILEAALGHADHQSALAACRSTVCSIPNPEVAAPLASLVAHAYMDLLEMKPPAAGPDLHFEALIQVTEVFGHTSHGAGSKIRLGHLLESTATAALRAPDPMSEQWYMVAELLRNPCIATETKQAVANRLRNTVAPEEWTFGAVSASDNRRTALLASSEFLQEPAKKMVASAGVEAIRNLPRVGEDDLIQLSRTVRSIPNKQDRDSLQSAIVSQLEATVWKSSGPFELIAELVQVGSTDEGVLLNMLLETVEQMALPRIREQMNQMNMIAVLTFHLDPDGAAIQPGTEKRDIDDIDSKNKEFVLSGATFKYPDWIAERRAVLQEHATWILNQQASPLLAGDQLPEVLAHISDAYVGPAVRASHWPALLSILKAESRSFQN